MLTKKGQFQESQCTGKSRWIREKGSRALRKICLSKGKRKIGYNNMIRGLPH